MCAFRQSCADPGGGTQLLLIFIVIFLKMTDETRASIDPDEFLSELDKPVPELDVLGVMGRKAYLPCDIQPLMAEDQANMVLWFKDNDGEPLYSFDIRGRHSSHPKIWSSAAVFGHRAFFRASASPAVLAIDNVTVADRGMFRCRVDFMNSPTRNARVNFSVITLPDRPVILDAKTMNPTKLLQPYNEGENLALICQVTGGSPRPYVTWSLESTVIDESFSQRADGMTLNELSFPSVGRQHLNARLVCQASNTNLVDPLTKVMILDVNLKPLSVNILSKNRRLSADHSYEVQCETTGSRPAAAVSWWKGGRQVKKNVREYSESNSTVSILTLVPESDDHETALVCRAENPFLPDAQLEDTWLLNVQYVPIVSLNMGSSLNPNSIKEGDDVYFECNVKANPKVHRLTWFKGNNEILHNSSANVILSDQSLVLQNVKKTAAGDYSCFAANSEGSGTSNQVSLQVRYAPICKNAEEGQVYGAMKKEAVQLQCLVDSNPPPTSFTWIFNNSGEQTEVPASAYTISGHTSTLNFTPTSDMHFGTVACSAHNAAGIQESPCLYRLVAAGHPMPPQNCSIVEQNSSGLQVECSPGFDGGLRQVFRMEVVEIPSMIVRQNITASLPVFRARSLDDRKSYTIRIYATNAKGRSIAVMLYTVAARSPDKYTGGANTPLTWSPLMLALSVLAVLLAAALCTVLAAWFKRHVKRRRRSDNFKPRSGNMYTMKSIDSISIKHDNVNSYTATSKLDYCGSQCDVNLHPAVVEEADEEPDVIPSSYEKFNSSENIKMTTLARKQSNPSNLSSSIALQSIPRVSRGVTARGADISFTTRPRPEVVTTSNRVKESCI